jgi:hypothetical protein
MTDDEHRDPDGASQADEALGEAIEDLEAPAEAPADVAGGGKGASGQAACGFDAPEGLPLRR